MNWFIEPLERNEENTVSLTTLWEHQYCCPQPLFQLGRPQLIRLVCKELLQAVRSTSAVPWQPQHREICRKARTTAPVTVCDREKTWKADVGAPWKQTPCNLQDSWLRTGCWSPAPCPNTHMLNLYRDMTWEWETARHHCWQWDALRHGRAKIPKLQTLGTKLHFLWWGENNKKHERCLQRQFVLSFHSRDAGGETGTYHAKRLACGWMSRAVSPLTIWRTFMDSGIRGSKNRTSPFTLPTQEFHNVRLYPEQILKPRELSRMPVCELTAWIRQLGQRRHAPLPSLSAQLNFHWCHFYLVPSTKR